jgi:hypothetical protein
MLYGNHKGETIVLLISFSTISIPYAIESLQGIRRQVYDLQGSGTILDG